MRLHTLILIATAAASRLSAQDIFIAPSHNSIVPSSEQSYGSTPGHLLYISNQSTVPIVVFGITLNNCENIRQPCSAQRIDVLVPAGDRRQVGRVDAREAHKPWRYRWGFSYRADSSNAQAMALLRAHGLTAEGMPVAEMGPVRPAPSEGTQPTSPSEPGDSTPARRFRFKVMYGSILGSTMMANAPIQVTGPCVDPAQSALYEKDTTIAPTAWRPPVLPMVGRIRIPPQFVDSTKKATDVLVRFAVDTTGETIPASASVLESPYGRASVTACRASIAAKGTPARDKNGNAVRAWVQVPLQIIP